MHVAILVRFARLAERDYESATFELQDLDQFRGYRLLAKIVGDA
jgi:hypothetical protein